jgi:hypothetical protein
LTFNPSGLFPSFTELKALLKELNRYIIFFELKHFQMVSLADYLKQNVRLKQKEKKTATIIPKIQSILLTTFFAIINMC